MILQERADQFHSSALLLDYDDGYGTAYDDQGYESYDNSYNNQGQKCGRVGKQSRQGPVSTSNQGSVQRSAILQILNCLYNPHPSPHGCLNPSNGFFYGRSHIFRFQN
ncbi:unnamed protein product [Tetraodon nigroviridis]|uniref:(spotted green pufferfish) hypothetical protein n=1 Tax=Tetraodon nigroviridis TaxID=99883 RepID=Q4S049_TETNG|nr:unnamed protein product [Tetraodon nigroviridis]